MNESMVSVTKMEMTDLISNGNWPVPFSNCLNSTLNELKKLDIGTFYLAKCKGSPELSIFKKSGQRTRFPDKHLIPKKQSGQEHIPIQWVGGKNHIPFTFQPIETPITKPMPLPFKFCNYYQRRGQCSKDDCRFAHIPPMDLNILCFSKNSRFTTIKGIDHWKDADAIENDVSCINYD